MNFDDLLDLLKVLTVEQRQMLAESLPIPTWQPGTAVEEITAGGIGQVLLDRDLTSGTFVPAKNITGGYIADGSRVQVRSDGGVMQIDSVSSPGFPAGVLLGYGGSEEPSWGVFANGQTLPTDPPYHRLAAALGETGETFTVPNAEGRVALYDSGSLTLLAVGGAMSRTIAQANLPNVNFTVTDPGHVHPIDVGSSPDFNTSVATVGVSDSGTNMQTNSATTGISVASGGSGTALDTTPAHIVVTAVWTL